MLNPEDNYWHPYKTCTGFHTAIIIHRENPWIQMNFTASIGSWRFDTQGISDPRQIQPPCSHNLHKPII